MKEGRERKGREVKREKNDTRNRVATVCPVLLFFPHTQNQMGSMERKNMTLTLRHKDTKNRVLESETAPFLWFCFHSHFYALYTLYSASTWLLFLSWVWENKKRSGDIISEGSNSFGAPCLGSTHSSFFSDLTHTPVPIYTFAQPESDVFLFLLLYYSLSFCPIEGPLICLEKQESH